MAQISITVTADTTAVPGLIPVLVAAAQEFMDAQTPKIDYSAMSNQQKVTRYTKEILMSIYVQRTTATAQATAASTVTSAQTQAITDAKAGLA